MIQISFVIPCYRSANTIIQVLKEIEDKMNERPDTIYEVITVNDSSPDNVLQVLKEYAETHSWLRVVDFTKNFGQHAAMMAGLSFASGKYIVFLDDDFQCPVDRIWDLLAPLVMIFLLHNINLKREKNPFSAFLEAVLTTL